MGRLIDADAPKEVIEDHVTSVSCCATVEQARGKTAFKHECLEDIDNAPTVDAVPVVHGKWEEKTYEMDVYGQKVTTVTYYCTICGAEHAYGRENYCPNCGAKMDGERRDDDADDRR